MRAARSAPVLASPTIAGQPASVGAQPMRAGGVGHVESPTAAGQPRVTAWTKPSPTRPATAATAPDAAYTGRARRHRARRAASERRARANRAAGATAVANRLPSGDIPLFAARPTTDTLLAEAVRAEPLVAEASGVTAAHDSGGGRTPSSPDGGIPDRAVTSRVVTVRSSATSPPTATATPPGPPPGLPPVEPAPRGGRRRPWVLAGGVAVGVAVIAIVVAVETSGGGSSKVTAQSSGGTVPAGPAASAPPSSAPQPTSPSGATPASTAPPTSPPAAVSSATCPTGGLSVLLTSTARPLGSGTWEVGLTITARSTATAGLRVGSVVVDLVVGGSKVGTVDVAPASLELRPGQHSTVRAATEVAGPLPPSVAFGGATATWTSATAGGCPLPH